MPEGGVETAKAKINLALHVMGRRPDGYHELDTVVVFAETGDRLSAEAGAGPGITLEIGGPFAAGLSADRNLVLEAAKAFFAEARESPPALHFRLEKNLPVAAGLGGGSADAAACLRLLDRMFGGVVGALAQHEIAARLGADVAMCLASTPQRARGRGERLAPVSGLPDLPLVLINPGTQLSTRIVFAGLSSSAAQPVPEPPRASDAAALVPWLKASANDLEASAMQLAPAVRTVLAALASLPGCLFARMSGSGPTCFGLFGTPEEAEAGAHGLRRERPGWWIKATLCKG